MKTHARSPNARPSGASTIYAAITALRKLNARWIVAATPAIAARTFSQIEKVVDEIVAIIVAEHFHGVGQWYEDFSQTTDEEVRAILARANARFRGAKV